MEVLNAQIQFGNSWNAIQREETFACEIVRRDNIVIHYSEGYHCALLCALLQSDSAELEALVEDGIQSFLQKKFSEKVSSRLTESDCLKFLTAHDICWQAHKTLFDAKCCGTNPISSASQNITL